MLHHFKVRLFTGGKEDNLQNSDCNGLAGKIWQKILMDFQIMYPDYRIYQHTDNNQAKAQKLLNDELDLAIMGAIPPFSSLISEPFRDKRIYLVVPNTHPLASRKEISFSDLKNETFIRLSEKTGFARKCDELFLKAGVAPRYSIECDYLLRSSMITSGFGIAITSSLGKTSDLLAPNCYIPITDPFAEWQLYIVYNPQHYMSHAARIFHDYLRSYLSVVPLILISAQSTSEVL